MIESMSDRIRQARISAGLTQTELAGRLGVTQSTVNRWEGGRHDPSRETATRLATTLGVGVEWIELGDRAEDAQVEHGVPRDPDDPAQYAQLFAHLRRNLDNPVIAYQGVPGAYSHMAANRAFPDLQAMSCPSFEDAFAAVDSGKAGLAMIPIENSLGGRVADIHHLLPESSLYIVGEHFQPVHHNLMAPKGAKLEEIREAHSHPQALAQCRETLRELRIKPVAHADTAGAAQEIAALGDPKVAAISSTLAAETYDLDVLRSRIEDKIGNVTRFVIMSRTRIEPDPVEGPAMTSFVFTVRSVPAALYKSMGGFATNGVNMIKLESYISVADYSTARFYAEIEGHPAERHVDRALEELQYFTTKVKVLGTYPQNPFRFQD